MAEKRAALRVLIADDNRDAMLTLGILVRSEGFVVKLTENGRQVLAVAPYFEPDIVLLDLRMPEMSGFEVAHALKQRYGERCPLLIAVSGQKREEDLRRARDCGFRHYVSKPYKPEALITLLNSVPST